MRATMLSRRGLLVGAGASTLLAACASAARSGGADYARLQALIDSYVSTRRLPSVVIAVKSGDGALRYLSGGSQALGAGPHANADTLYRVYSMTKPITAVAALKLVEEGRLALDQPISDFIPEFAATRVLENFQTGGTRASARAILVRHLMTHTSGLSYHINPTAPVGDLYRQRGIIPGGRAGVPAAGQPALPTSLDEFGPLVAATPLARDPGTAWEYSIGLDVLGLVIQRAARMPFEDYLRTALFEPLRMRDTAFFVSEEQARRLVPNYRIGADGALTMVDDPARTDYRNPVGMPCGGAGLVSSTRDYARFCTMILNGGALEGRRVLSSLTAALAGANLMPEGVYASGRNGFGAAMQVSLPGGGAAERAPVGSFGWGGAAGTAFWIDPAAHAFVVMMVNYFGALPIRRELGEAAYADFAA